jgi:autotransporter strand-loop-strand O-heptosyltransferase
MDQPIDATQPAASAAVDAAANSGAGSGSGSSSSSSSGSASGSGPEPAQDSPKQHFIPPPELPTQLSVKGLRFDFNDGCRVLLEHGQEQWRVRISDLDTGNILFDTRLDKGRVNSSKRYFVRFLVEVWSGDQQVLKHAYNAQDQEVLVQLPVGTLGDTIGWFPYAARFKEQHNCRLSCAMAEHLIPLFKDAYPDINFISQQQVEKDHYYATYRIGLFFSDDAHIYQPCDFRLVGLHRTAGYILGVDPSEQPPRIQLTDHSRPIDERYVCIATQSTTQCKYWNNPHGWHEVIRYLKQQGYRVICIDQKPVHGFGIVWNHMPYGAEDQTGDRPLLERARWLKHADFFIGLGSGLSWLAWAMGVPVVLISGFSHPNTEFATPYRVINYHACNSCWEDVRLRFDHKDFLWCPRHKGTLQQFECTRLITAEAVKNTIKRIPGFVEKSVEKS